MSSDRRQIVALGGGGFSEEKDPALDRYILETSGVERPAIAFLGTASGDSERYIAKFYARFVQLDCRPSHVALFGRVPDLREFVAAQDVVFVGGGNTKSMLAAWRGWDLPEILREAWEAGTVLSGISAGAICWFDRGVTDSGAGHLSALDCLGLLPGSCCPHYDGESARQAAYHAMLEGGQVAAGVALDDGAAVHYRGDKPWRVVSQRPDARALRVECRDGVVRETPLEVERVDPG
jgi:peptidase E